uniref:Uncharacterized protein n=1 Tax=Hyaloperonospora arabidopsidis (strain Emoy2) TaxID=559515 RepID=M4BJ85_HYAAE
MYTWTFLDRNLLRLIRYSYLIIYNQGDTLLYIHPICLSFSKNQDLSDFFFCGFIASNGGSMMP